MCYINNVDNKEKQMRKLASIRKIADIRPIQDADAIEVAVVDGWKVVVKKGEYSVGDLAVYIEIDSWVPTELAPFLSKGQEPREYNGVKGERLRTVKLRGQVSQGLLLKIEDDIKTRLLIAWQNSEIPGDADDVTDLFGIQKWEPVLPAQLQGQVRGMFPTNLIPKTDQERIQNCFPEIEAKGDVTYEVTMKLDGTSCTIFRWEGELRVCSRNLELKVNDENKDNTLVAMALKIGDRIPEGFALQGELMGPNIQGNREGFTEHNFFVFDVFLIKEHAYAGPAYRRALCKEYGFEHVPVLYQVSAAPASVDAGLALAEGPSITHKIREGLVWKCNEDPGFSFKTISNAFLLKSGD
jgi:RNA ligase (TIGR02306 family)